MASHEITERFKYYAQYMGQRVLRIEGLDKLQVLDEMNLRGVNGPYIDKSHLELRDPETINPHELDMLNAAVLDIEDPNEVTCIALDVMRSMGFATQYKRDKTEALVEKGWLKIVSDEQGDK